MHQAVISDIKKVLNSAKKTIKRKNYYRLDGLSNQLNHSITIYQNKAISTCAVITFALSKIFNKRKYTSHRDFSEFKLNILKLLNLASKAISSADIITYMRYARAIELQIKQFSSKIKIYHIPLLNYARAKKANSAVEHGLSINQASKLFDVPEWEISKHVGKSAAHEKHYAPQLLNRRRINLIKNIFNIK